MWKLLALLIMVMSCWTCMVEAEYFKYKDPKQPMNVRIRDLMKRMTLEEKIGQMTQIDRSVASNEVMKKYFIGSVLSIPLPISYPANEASPKAWIDMVNDYQNGSLSTRLGIPMIYGIDAVHGHNDVYKATIFPHNVGLGVTRQIGAATALEVRATGIRYAFAPCIAVCRDPRWGRCYESYSEDPKIVKLMTEIIPGLQGDIPAGSRKGVPFVGGQKKIAACAKHYLGDGGTHEGIDQGNTIIDAKGLFSIHMPAYYDAIIKGVATIMTSYSSWNGGFVISDFQGLDRITTPIHANFTYSIIASMNAGIDM
ncbi:beta-glucosidase BoGH3B, partial [Tanacetum coccineum]